MGVIRLVEDGDLDGDLLLEDPAAAPTELWRRLASRPVLQEAVEHATRTLVEGCTRPEAEDALQEAGVDALGGLYAAAAVEAAAREDREDLRGVVDELRRDAIAAEVARILVDETGHMCPGEDVTDRTDMAGDQIRAAAISDRVRARAAAAADELAEATPIHGTWSALHAAGRSLGGQTTLGPSGGMDAILDGPVQLLAASGIQPTLDVALGRDFMTQPPARRADLLEFFTDLSAGLTVRLHCGPVIRGAVLEQHAEDLPASCVNDAADQRPTAVPSSDVIQERVEEALAALEWRDPAWRTLWVIVDDPREERPYSELYADQRLDVGKSAIRKQLGRLEDAGLVEKSREGNTHLARATRVGVEAAERLQEDVGLGPGPNDARDSDARETAADGAAADGSAAGASPEGCGGKNAHTGPEAADAGGPGGGVNDPPNSSAGAVLSPCEGGRGEAGSAAEGQAAAGAGRSTPSRPPRTEWLPRRRHAAIAGAAGELDVALVDAPVPQREHPGDRRVSFDEDREEIVVDVEAHPTRLAVTAARYAAALASNELMYSHTGVDLPSRLNEGGPLEGLDVNEIVLRKGRCIGWLSDEDLEGLAFTDRLRRAREQLLEDTGRLTTADGEYRSDVASSVLADALGLAGTLTHIYDLLGIDVHRHVAFPEWNRNWNPGKDARRQAVKKFIAYTATIGSRYGHYPMYRKLYEDRELKREDALQGPAVDPGDPVGDHIGTWTLSGPGISDFSAELRNLTAGWDVHPDAVDAQREFSVDLEIGQGWRRSAVVGVGNRVLERKRMRLSSSTTSVLLGLLGSPFDLADALDRLDRETKAPEPRRLELDELRFALSTLPTGRLLPSTTPASRQIVAALLGTDDRLSTAQLAERADVQEATVREHRDRLEALGLLEVDELGEGRATLHRLQLPTRAERFDEAAPAPSTLEPESPRGVAHLVEEVLLELGDSVAVAAPELWSRVWPADGEDIDLLWREGPWRWLEQWADLLAAFAGEEIGGRLEWSGGPLLEEARLGAEPSAPASRQLSLQQALGLSPAD